VVQGRFIAQPENLRKLIAHEVSVDDDCTFPVIMVGLKRLASEGVNCLYICGALESDQSRVTARHRSLINSKAGKLEQLEELIEKAHEYGIKVILDFSPRISTSRFSNRYRNQTLHTLVSGRVQPLY
jgi:hypothetical protein